jgi:hypothetical protein
VKHEVVVPTGNGQRVELDRAELAEDLEHGSGPSLERPRRREKLTGNEKAPRSLSGDPHRRDAS